MCWNCHRGLGDETIAKQLASALEEPSFERRWDYCSVSQLLIIGSGYNGEDNRRKANTLLDMYKRHLLANRMFFRWAQVKTWQSTFRLPTEIPSPV